MKTFEPEVIKNLFSIKESGTAKVKAVLVRYKPGGPVYLDVRRFIIGEDGEVPTPKGLAMTLEMAEKFMDVLQEKYGSIAAFKKEFKPPRA